MLLRLEAADERTLVKRVKALAPAAQEEGAAVHRRRARRGRPRRARDAGRRGRGPCRRPVPALARDAARAPQGRAHPRRRRPAFEGRRHDGGRGRGRLSALRRAAPGRLAAAPRSRRSSAPPGGPRSSRRPASPSRRRSTPCRALPRPAPSSSPSATPSGTIRTARRPPSGPRSRRSPRRRRRADAAPAPAFGLAALLAGPAIGQPAGLRPSVEAARLAPEPDLAYGAYQRGLYLTAVREATARLDRDPDDAAAMTLLGEIHNQGLGIAAGSAEGGGVVSACGGPRQTRTRSRRSA